jgi:hypothetical protein
VYREFLPPALTGVLAVPFAAGLAIALAGRRERRGATRSWAWRSSVAEVGMIVGTVPWLWTVLTPDPGHPRGRNLIPFHDLANQFHVGLAFAAVQITGNLLVFAALGFFLPMRWRVGLLFVLVVAALCSTTVEVLQWVLRLGRFSSVDDVIVNTAGAVLAALCSRPWWRRRSNDPECQIAPEQTTAARV